MHLLPSKPNHFSMANLFVEGPSKYKLDDLDILLSFLFLLNEMNEKVATILT